VNADKVTGAFARQPDPLFTFMGGRVDGVGEGRARVSLEITDAVRNPNGRTHGSILFALLDFAMGAALYSDDRAMARTATVQMDMHFVKSAREGMLRCEAWVVRRGRLVSFAEGHIRDDAGDLVARGTATFTTAAG
jgi:uncharacterized protein (TIGR00369 family)